MPKRIYCIGATIQTRWEIPFLLYAVYFFKKIVRFSTLTTAHTEHTVKETRGCRPVVTDLQLYQNKLQFYSPKKNSFFFRTKKPITCIIPFNDISSTMATEMETAFKKMETNNIVHTPTLSL